MPTEKQLAFIATLIAEQRRALPIVAGDPGARFMDAPTPNPAREARFALALAAIEAAVPTLEKYRVSGLIDLLRDRSFLMRAAKFAADRAEGKFILTAAQVARGRRVDPGFWEKINAGDELLSPEEEDMARIPGFLDAFAIEESIEPYHDKRDPASAKTQAAAVNPLEGAVFMVTTEYADEPTCNTEHCYLDQLPSGYEYLAPILTAPEFVRLQFTVDLTRVTIVKSA